MSKSTRIRISPSIATQLGLTVNSSNRYRLNAERRTEWERLTATETNQYEKRSPVLSALKADGSIMTIQEYCKVYGLDYSDVRSYKLISHTGTPFYNIGSNILNDGEDAFDDEFVNNLIGKLSNHSPSYKSFDRPVVKDNNLLVIDIADLHINKLSLAYETGENYNINIATQRAIEGFNGILKKAENFNVNKLLIVIGNDVLHTDNARSMTTSGTFQDTQTSLTEAFNVALNLYTSLIDSVISKYDVDVVFNPSNHDYMSGWMLARTIETWYRNTKNVTVFSDMTHRKYYKYGVNMICTSHGDGAKMQDMPLLMATDRPMMWAETKYRYVYLHHIHHKQVTKFQSAKDYIGITVEYLRSPSAADRWHATNGYCGAKQAIEGFIHSEDNGQVARISHYF